MLRRMLSVCLSLTAVVGSVVADEGPQYLFVQNSSAVKADGSTLTLKGVTASTLFFSDRPFRIAGHLATEEFVANWGMGEGNFASDPPNATLSVFGDDKVIDVVVILKNPRLAGKNLLYDVEVLEGDLPARGGPSALFIDIIGRPLTPVSVAGVHRRTRRRAVVVGGTAAVATAGAVATADAASSAPPPAAQAPPPATPPPAAPTAEEQLKTLKSLLDQGLITKDEYDKKTAEIVKKM